MTTEKRAHGRKSLSLILSGAIVVAGVATAAPAMAGGIYGHPGGFHPHVRHYRGGGGYGAAATGLAIGLIGAAALSSAIAASRQPREVDVIDIEDAPVVRRAVKRPTRAQREERRRVERKLDEARRAARAARAKARQAKAGASYGYDPKMQTVKLVDEAAGNRRNDCDTLKKKLEVEKEALSRLDGLVDERLGALSALRGKVSLTSAERATRSRALDEFSNLDRSAREKRQVIAKLEARIAKDCPAVAAAAPAPAPAPAAGPTPAPAPAKTPNWASAIAPDTGVTTTSVGNEDGSRTVVKTDAAGKVISVAQSR